MSPGLFLIILILVLLGYFIYDLYNKVEICHCSKPEKETVKVSKEHSEVDPTDLFLDSLQSEEELTECVKISCENCSVCACEPCECEKNIESVLNRKPKKHKKSKLSKEIKPELESEEPKIVEVN